MNKTTNSEIQQIWASNSDKRSLYYYWAKVNESIINFERNANVKTFQYLFGDQAERLQRHFVYDCDSKFQKFLTYLTQPQKNELIFNVHENADELYI